MLSHRGTSSQSILPFYKSETLQRFHGLGGFTYSRTLLTRGKITVTRMAHCVINPPLRDLLHPDRDTKANFLGTKTVSLHKEVLPRSKMT